MTTELQVFDFKGYEIDIQSDEQGNLWFKVNDLCRILAFVNPRSAVKNNVFPEDVLQMHPLRNTPGGQQQANYVNESGLYALIFASRKIEAVSFKRWITSEIIPKLRKTGKYEINPSSQDQILQAIEVFKFTRGQLITYGEAKHEASRKAYIKAQVVTGINLPKTLEINIPNKLLEAETKDPKDFTNPWKQYWSATQLGERLDITPYKFNKLLERYGFLIREGRVWTPTERAKGFYEDHPDIGWLPVTIYWKEEIISQLKPLL